MGVGGGGGVGGRSRIFYGYIGGGVDVVFGIVYVV